MLSHSLTTKTLLVEPLEGITLKNKVQLKSSKQNGKIIAGEILKAGTKLNIQIVPNKYDVDGVWDELQSCGKHSDSEFLKLDFKKKPKWVSGSHTSLKYRGNSIGRTKMWFQEVDDRMFIYNYTGFQYGVANATSLVSNLPQTRSLVEQMKASSNANHWIATKYEDENDSIGLHSDKTKNWVKNSSLHVVKFGHPRRFQLVLNDEQETVLFDMVLPSGTSVVCDTFANSVTKHGVPRCAGQVGVSGSLVGRSIETDMRLEEFQKKVERCMDDKRKRKLAKEKKNDEKLAKDEM